ncbi:TolA-binding protein [Povalibacter uvarum]|uniref:TolA-binding protein n=1 Tax=Povalibacter uvarum TaxID=732238 RepID=A0A841HKF1_9GAMM|nr:hypothetical protein [Povalibacter uvarum]MBB6093527.1 TolA-binding protein [Povalibacter uvarum]
MKSLRHTFIFLAAAVALGGCVSTPSTKALITPIGAVGVYSFAPTEKRSPDEMKAARQAEQRLARMNREEAENTAPNN